MSKIRRSFTPEDRYSIVQEAIRDGHADRIAEAVEKEYLINKKNGAACAGVSAHAGA